MMWRRAGRGDPHPQNHFPCPPKNRCIWRARQGHAVQGRYQFPCAPPLPHHAVLPVIRPASTLRAWSGWDQAGAGSWGWGGVGVSALTGRAGGRGVRRTGKSRGILPLCASSSSSFSSPTSRAHPRPLRPTSAEANTATHSRQTDRLPASLHTPAPPSSRQAAPVDVSRSGSPIPPLLPCPSTRARWPAISNGTRKNRGRPVQRRATIVPAAPGCAEAPARARPVGFEVGRYGQEADQG